MDIIDFIKNYAGGGMAVSEPKNGTNSLIEFFINNDEKKKSGRFLSVYFDGQKVNKAELTSKGGLIEAHSNDVVMGDLILR